MKIFVARLNFRTQDDQLESLFQEYGDVDSANIVYDKMTGKSRGFGFVEMPSDDEAQAAIEALDGTEFDGRTIVVKKARPRRESGGNQWRS